MQRGYLEIAGLILLFLIQLQNGVEKLNSNSQHMAEAMTNSQNRVVWEKQMLGDPRTGEIPLNIRQGELDFAKRFTPDPSRNSNAVWTWLGPKNIGGRTRALQIDRTNTNIILAGSASGGIFRSENGGVSWQKVSNPEHNLAITSLAQNPNPGKTNEWYACTGEQRGGTQLGYSNAVYTGNGILKSQDGGKSWSLLSRLQNPSPQSTDSTDRGWRILVSHNGLGVFFASSAGILRSTNDGASWDFVAGRSNINSGFTDIVQTQNGTLYAALGSGGFSNVGVLRSTDGTNWTLVSAGVIPGNADRIVLATDDQFQGERIYVFAETPNQGKVGEDFQGNKEYHSLYQYTYLSGSGLGAGGIWVNRSSNLPSGPFQFDDYVSQSGYCMDINVSPFDSNVVIIGGTNLYISTSAFKTDSNTTYAGGYGEKTEIPDFQLYPNHHPDLQTIVFHPSDSNILFTGSDGGIHRCDNLYADSIIWESLNNAYSTTQFYTLAIDRTGKSNKIMGGLQDNGTLLNISGDWTANWTLPLSYDGAYCSFSDKEPHIYASKQLAGIAKIELNAKGERVNWKRIDPVTSANYLFINPYMLDESDNNIMYLPLEEELWINNDLKSFTPDGSFTQTNQNWTMLNLPNGTQPSTITSSKNPEHRVLIGSTTGSILKVTDPLGSASITNITNSIDGKGYVSSISVDPKDENHMLVTFANYNTYSVFTTSNGGQTWENISGNLEGPPMPHLPQGLEFVNNGPSCRVGKIIYLNGNRQYLIGTSVGLFSTANLDSMKTFWSPFGYDYLHNSIVTALEYRESDAYLAVATFGNGIYQSYLNGPPSSTLEHNSTEDLMVFPNPASERIQLNVENGKSYRIYSLSGQVAQTGRLENDREINISKLQKGTYVLTVESGDRDVLSSTFIKK